jgi:hypothetical protein
MQHSLLIYLQKARQVNIVQVWVGGERNRERGICLQLAYDWCGRVIEAQGPPSTAGELLARVLSSDYKHWCLWKGTRGAQRIREEGIWRGQTWQALGQQFRCG